VIIFSHKGCFFSGGLLFETKKTKKPFLPEPSVAKEEMV
jgi:hypothetical protein